MYLFILQYFVDCYRYSQHWC